MSKAEYNLDDLMKKRALTRGEAAFYLGISENTLNAIIHRPTFPALIRLGTGRGRVFIHREKLDKWLDEQAGA